MARRKTRASVLAERRRRTQTAPRKTPSRILAQTYLDRFEAETPRAPLQRFPQPIPTAQTAPPPVPELGGRKLEEISQQFRQLQPTFPEPERFPSLPVAGIGGFALQRGEFQPRIGGGLFERMAQGPAQMAAIYHGLGVNLGQQFPGSIFGTDPASAAFTENPAYLRSAIRYGKLLMSGLMKKARQGFSYEPLYDPGEYYYGGVGNGGVGGGTIRIIRGGGTPGSQGRNYKSGLINWRI